MKELIFLRAIALAAVLIYGSLLVLEVKMRWMDRRYRALVGNAAAEKFYADHRIKGPRRRAAELIIWTVLVVLILFGALFPEGLQ